MTDAPDLAGLKPSWIVYLKALRRSPQTIRSYSAGVDAYLQWCAENDLPATLDRRQVAAFTTSLLTAGARPMTARGRQTALRQFSKWLTEEDEQDHDPLLGIKPPSLDKPVVVPLSETEIKALLKACAGKRMVDRRDEAVVRFMVETGCRADEVVGLRLDGVDCVKGIATVWGKGSKGRTVPFGPKTAQAIDRYKRARRAHRLAETPALWLGADGKGFSYGALYAALKRRAAAAGVRPFWPHRLRHTAAHRWLAAGGSEHGLMAVAGWSSPEMIGRYTNALAADRAAEEARRLNLGDL